MKPQDGASTGVDRADTNGDRTGFTLGQMADGRFKQWDGDPVEFAQQLGLRLNREEQQLLCASMANAVPRSRRQRRLLDRIVEKMARRIEQSQLPKRIG